MRPAMETGTNPMRSHDPAGRIAWHYPQRLYPAVTVLIGLAILCITLATHR